MNIRPRGRRLVVDVVFDVIYENKVVNLDGEGEFIEGSSVIIAPKVKQEEVKTPTDRCVIVVGNDEVDDLKEGDLCIFNERAGVKISYLDKDYLLLPEVEIYAVIEAQKK